MRTFIYATSKRSRAWLWLLAGFERTIVSNWWVVIFLLLAFVAFDTARQGQIEAANRLEARIATQESLIAIAQERREDLTLKLNSLADLEWQELVLMQALGVAPANCVKIYFQDGDS